MSKDRIPQGLRKEINRVGPGKYCDPATGRIYVDSADMDEAFEEMIDGTKKADEARDLAKEKELRADRPRPPMEIEELAVQQLYRHADRLGGGIDVKAAKSRHKHLLGKQAWRRSLGEDLDDKELEELAALLAALGANEDGNTSGEGDSGA